MNTACISDIGRELTASLAKMGQIHDLNREWEEALHLGTAVIYPKNTVIPHERIKGMYYLAKGAVTISYSSFCGRERSALFIGPGCLFNEARTSSGYEPGGRFTCMEETLVYRFPESILEDMEFIRSHPALIANLLRSMSLKMLIHYSFLTDMGLGSPERLLCRFIVNLSHKFAGEKSFPAGKTQQEIADLLGMHRITLARAVSHLKQKGVITVFTRKEVHINDYALLLAMAD